MEKRYIIAIYNNNGLKGEILNIHIKPESELKSFVYGNMWHQNIKSKKFNDKDDIKQYWYKICNDIIEGRVEKQEILCENAVITIIKDGIFS